MNESLQSQIETYLSRLEDLIQRGRQVREALTTDSSDRSALLATRMWQHDCGHTIHELSGGSKAHWLSRAFSDAFLLRSSSGSAVEGVAPVEIVARLLDVLEQAVVSLTKNDESAIASASTQAPPPRRFNFVHNRELRPVLEQAYIDSRRDLDEGRYGEALRTCCGVLEAIVTDALDHKGLGALAAANPPAGNIADWPFETRLAVAERAGLMRGGWARLPAPARKYRDHHENEPTISERDARQAMQVLHVVMRDLDPGR